MSTWIPLAASFFCCFSSCFINLRSLRLASFRMSSSWEMGSPEQVWGWALWAGRPGPFLVFDYMENYEFLGEDWVRIMENGVKEGDFRRMYSRVDACTDMPCCFYWEEILREFPDAKVIYVV